MSSYVRPAVAEQTYRDADGAVIEYGNQWGVEGPPADRYSVDSHPERFAALHQIANALIDYLQEVYQVEITDDLSCARVFTHPPVDVLRAVRVEPASGDAAAMTFAFTGYPGVVVHAGLLHDFWYPACGCDACDETWQSVADELEWNVLAVVSGGYREEVRGSRREPWIAYELRSTDGSRRSGGSAASSDAGAQIRAAARRLTALPDGWAAWPPR